MMINESMAPNNRSNARLPLGFRAIFYTNAIDGNGLVVNLSRVGAYLVTPAKLRLHQNVELIVMIGNRSRQRFSGKVVRRDQLGFAVFFTNGAQEAERLICDIEGIVRTSAVAEALAELPSFTGSRQDSGPAFAVA